MGALSSKPYLFKNKVWELFSTESIDIFDSLCTNIQFNVKDNVIERVLPKITLNLSDDWITDKIRFCYDGFYKQRLSLPGYKYKHNHLWNTILCSWHLVFNKIKISYYLYYNSFLNNYSFYNGHLIDVFTLYTLKKLSLFLGFTNINLNLNFNIDLRKYFIFNNNINNFESNNLFLILGTNPKIDSPVLNIRIRKIKFYFNKKVNVFYIGNKIMLNYDMVHLGLSSINFINILLGKHFSCFNFIKVYNIICLFSINFNLIKNHLILLTLDNLSFFLKNQNFIYNYISLFSSDVSIYELGIHSYYYSSNTYINRSNLNWLYLLGVDYYKSFFKTNQLKNKFIIYHGHHGDHGISTSHILLPSKTFVENTSYFLNCEGRFLISNLIINKEKKENSNESILYNLFNYVSSKISKFYIKLKNLFFFFFFISYLFFLLSLNLWSKKTFIFFLIKSFLINSCSLIIFIIITT